MSGGTHYPSMAELMQLFISLTAHRAFRGSHLSIDRDARGNVYVAVAPDWIDESGLRYLLELVARFEVAVALTDKGLRIESHSSEMVEAVDLVKTTLDEEDDENDD